MIELVAYTVVALIVAHFYQPEERHILSWFVVIFWPVGLLYLTYTYVKGKK